MPTYSMVYGDDEQVVRETFEDVDVQREDGWTVLFRGGDAILRVRDDHVQSLGIVDAAADEVSGLDRPLVVGDVMHEALATVELHAHLAAAAYVIKEAGESALVITSDDEERRPLAILTDSDIVQAIADGNNPDETRISELVSRDPVFVTRTTKLREAAQLMMQRKIQHLPVVDDGTLVGLVNIADLCSGLLPARS